MILFGNLWRFRSVICGIKKRNIYWLTQTDKKTRVRFLINNLFQQPLRGNNIARAQEEQQEHL